MTVSRHAWKASTPGGSQFDSFSLSQGPSPQQELREWSQSSPHSYRWRVQGCQEAPLRGWKIWGDDPGRRPCVFAAPLLDQDAALHVFRVPNWTPGWGCRKRFQRSLRTRVWTPFFLMSWAVWILNHFPMISNLYEFRWFRWYFTSSFFYQ